MSWQPEKPLNIALNSLISLNSLERRAILTLSGIFSLRMLGLFMILPVFSLYANKLLDVTPERLGMTLGIYGLTQAIFQLPLGFLSDRFGRKQMIMIGLIVFSLGSIMAAISTSIWGVMAGRAFQGAGAVGSVLLAWVADLTREEVRIRAMASIGITIGLSFVLAMVLGPSLYGVIGMSGLFWLTAGLGGVGIMVLAWALPNSDSLPQNIDIINILENKVNNINNVKSLNTVDKVSNEKLGNLAKTDLKFPVLQLYFGVWVLHASLTALFLKIPLILQALGFSSHTLWQAYLPVFGLALVLSFVLFFLSEKRAGLKNIILPLAVSFLFCSELGLWLFVQHSGFAASLDSSYPVKMLIFLSLLTLFFLGFNILEASLPAFISKLAPKNARGKHLGIFSSAQFLGLFSGGALGGWLEGKFGPVTVFGFCVILALIWLLWIFKNLLNGGVNYGKRH